MLDMLSHLWVKTNSGVSWPQDLSAFTGLLWLLSLWELLDGTSTTYQTMEILFSIKNLKVVLFQWADFEEDCRLLRRRQRQPTPVLLPGKSHGWRSLVGYSPWGREELDMTERLHFHFSLSCTGEENGNPFQYSSLENPRDGSLVGCHLWVHTELDTTDMTQQQQQQ